MICGGKFKRLMDMQADWRTKRKGGLVDEEVCKVG